MEARLIITETDEETSPLIVRVEAEGEQEEPASLSAWAAAYFYHLALRPDFPARLVEFMEHADGE
jgi:hypothetical protein